jgi:branched-chain amino acid transport system permease protein
MDYALHIVVLFCIYTSLAVSLDILTGHTGLLSITQAAFFGLGAYTSALFATRLGAPFLFGVLAGILLAALISFVISLPSLRLHDDYFVIATFGFQVIVFSTFNNRVELTGGPLGIPGIPQPVILGWPVNTQIKFVAVAAVFAWIVFLVANRITKSPFGRVLHAIREDEVFAKALGKNTLYFKVTAFAASAALAATAGSLYAHYISYIDPTSFTVMESILVISMVIIGGSGSMWGPLVGAVLLVTLPEALRFVGLPSAAAANLRQIIYGSLLVIMMMFRPRGLVGKYGFTK